MSPPLLFRVDEVREDPNVFSNHDIQGNWVPSTDSGANKRVAGGASTMWWFCNGQGIVAVPPAHTPNGQPPQGASHYSVFSMYYSSGYGFWVLRGDAETPPPGEAWRPLRFDHDEDDYSSYVTSAGQERTLGWQRINQAWPRMLLPDIYHNVNAMNPPTAYGGLKGDLAIFLALVAFCMPSEQLAASLPAMFMEGAWKVYGFQHHGRAHGRGVVVYVYTCPQAWGGGSTRQDLHNYEEGVLGKYYY